MIGLYIPSKIIIHSYSAGWVFTPDMLWSVGCEWTRHTSSTLLFFPFTMKVRYSTRSALLACILELEGLWSKGHHLEWAILGPLISHNVTENYTLDVSPWDFGVCYYSQEDSCIFQAQSGRLAFKKRGKTFFHAEDYEWREGYYGHRSFFSGGSKQTDFCQLGDMLGAPESHPYSGLCLHLFFSLNGCWFFRVCWLSSNFQTISTSEVV